MCGHVCVHVLVCMRACVCGIHVCMWMHVCACMCVCAVCICVSDCKPYVFYVFTTVYLYFCQVWWVPGDPDQHQPSTWGCLLCTHLSPQPGVQVSGSPFACGDFPWWELLFEFEIQSLCIYGKKGRAFFVCVCNEEFTRVHLCYLQCRKTS